MYAQRFLVIGVVIAAIAVAWGVGSNAHGLTIRADERGFLCELETEARTHANEVLTIYSVTDANSGAGRIMHRSTGSAHNVGLTSAAVSAIQESMSSDADETHIVHTHPIQTPPSVDDVETLITFANIVFSTQGVSRAQQQAVFDSVSFRVVTEGRVWEYGLNRAIEDVSFRAALRAFVTTRATQGESAACAAHPDICTILTFTDGLSGLQSVSVPGYVQQNESALIAAYAAHGIRIESASLTCAGDQHVSAGGSAPGPGASNVSANIGQAVAQFFLSSTFVCLADLDDSLDPGERSARVAGLQHALGQNPSIYPEGLTTGFYGPLTTRAVQRFQETKDIVSRGSPETTGYGRVGPKTREALAEDCTLFDFPAEKRATRTDSGTRAPRDSGATTDGGDASVLDLSLLEPALFDILLGNLPDLPELLGAEPPAPSGTTPGTRGSASSDSQSGGSGGATQPFGGPITFMHQCNNGIFVQLGPPTPGFFMWTPATKSYAFGPPTHVGQYLLGQAGPPMACLVPCPSGVCTFDFGKQIIFHGSSQ